MKNHVEIHTCTTWKKMYPIFGEGLFDFDSRLKHFTIILLVAYGFEDCYGRQFPLSPGSPHLCVFPSQPPAIHRSAFGLQVCYSPWLLTSAWKINHSLLPLHPCPLATCNQWGTRSKLTMFWPLSPVLQWRRHSACFSEEPVSPLEAPLPTAEDLWW